MLFRVLADAFFLLHAAFIAFVGLGGLLVWRWPRLVWVHLPVVVWGVIINFAPWACPLTGLENAARRRAGQAGYERGFIEHYLEPVVYPENLTHDLQVALAVLVIVLNSIIYAVPLARRAHRRRASG